MHIWTGEQKVSLEKNAGMEYYFQDRQIAQGNLDSCGLEDEKQNIRVAQKL